MESIDVIINQHNVPVDEVERPRRSTLKPAARVAFANDASGNDTSGVETSGGELPKTKKPDLLCLPWFLPTLFRF